MKKNNNAGMTIVEVLVSVVIISLVMSLLFTLLIQVQNANAATAEKSSLLISQAVITKAIEQDIIEIGLNTVSQCKFTDFGMNTTQIDSGSDSLCLRLEYNLTFDVNDVGYLVIYKQNKETYGDSASWIIKYARGFYEGCEKGEAPGAKNHWMENFVVIQKLSNDVDIALGSGKKVKVDYSAKNESGVKYALQKANAGNINIEITDKSDNFRYDLDFPFTFRLYYNDSKPDTESRFFCDNFKIECNCSSDNDFDCQKSFINSAIYNADKRETESVLSNYKYTCSETKIQSASISGLSRSFWDLEVVTGVGITKENVKEIIFYNAHDDVPEAIRNAPIDVSRLRNGSVVLYYVKTGGDYTLHITPAIGKGPGVFMSGPSMKALFKGCTNLTRIDFTGFDSEGIENMSSLFEGCTNLTVDGLVGFYDLDLSSVTNMNSMFKDCKKITKSPFRYKVTKESYGDKVDYASEAKELKSLIDSSYMFYNSTLPNFTFGADFNAVKLQNVSYMFAYSDVTSISIQNYNLPELRSMESFAMSTSKLNSVSIQNVNFPELTSMKNAFRDAGYTGTRPMGNGLLTINFHTFRADKLVNASGLFHRASLKTEGGITFYQVYFTNIQDMSYMFAETDIKSFGFGWYNYSAFIPVSVSHNGDQNSLKTYKSSITNTSYMFKDCYQFESFSLTNYDFVNLENASHMFENTKIKNLNITNLKITYHAFVGNCYDIDNNNHGPMKADSNPKLTNASYMFFGTGDGTTSFDGWFDQSFFKNTRDFSYMFCNANYSSISLKGIASGIANGVINMNYMFYYNPDNWIDDVSTCSTAIPGQDVHDACGNADSYGDLSKDKLATVDISGLKSKVAISDYKLMAGRTKLKLIYIGELFNSTNSNDVTVYNNSNSRAFVRVGTNLTPESNGKKKFEVYLRGTYLPTNFLDTLNPDVGNAGVDGYRYVYTNTPSNETNRKKFLKDTYGLDYTKGWDVKS